MPPFAGFEDFGECKRTMMDEEGHDEASAENICGALQAEAKTDHGNVEELRQALERGAGLIADVGVDLVSGVDVPAVDSKWVMTKDADGHDFRTASPILLDKDADTDQRISYAAAMIPREPDKEGDVVATPTVEQAAHDFLKQDGGVDTDHSLIDGEGEVIESWVLKDERTFDLPGGETETYGAGTWMVGIEWGTEAWERIKSGDLTGLSIYGMAEHVPLQRSATAKQLDIPLANEAVVHLVYESRTAAEKASEEIGLGGAVHEHTFDDMDVWMPGETHDAFVERYMELSEEADARSASTSDSPDTHKGADPKTDDMAQDTTGDGGDTSGDGDSTADDGPDLGEVAASVESLTESVESIKEAVETQKQDAQEAASILGDEVDMAASDLLDIVEAAAGHDSMEVLEAIDSLNSDEMEQASDEAKESDEDDDEDDEMDKRADEAHLGKGGDTTGTAAKAHEQTGGSGGTPSYAAAAEQYEGDT